MPEKTTWEAKCAICGERVNVNQRGDVYPCLDCLRHSKAQMLGELFNTIQHYIELMTRAEVGRYTWTGDNGLREWAEKIIKEGQR